MSIVGISKEADKKLGACVACIIAQSSAVVRGEFSATFTRSFLGSEGTANPLPADAITIPATARGAFHLPPAANKAANRAARYVR